MENEKPVQTFGQLASAVDNSVATSSIVVPPSGPEGYIEWSASEFIDHAKGGVWYLALLGSTIVIAALSYVFTKDIITTLALIFVGILAAISAARKPKEQVFRLDDLGLTIGTRVYPFENYHSFAIQKEGAFSTLMLVPLKRFGLIVAAHYDPADEDKIFQLVGARLPLKDRHQDFLDRLLWRIHF